MHGIRDGAMRGQHDDLQSRPPVLQLLEQRNAIHRLHAQVGDDQVGTEAAGGRQRLGGISREGNERLRQLLVVGAMAVIRHAKPGSKSASPWLLNLLERRPKKLAAVALANKMARIVWAMLTSGEAYRAPTCPKAA